MTNPPGADGRAVGAGGDETVTSVAQPSAVALHTPRAGLFGARYRITRRRRHCKALDRMLSPVPTVDPWTLSLPVEDVYHFLSLGWLEREALGRQMARASR